MRTAWARNRRGLNRGSRLGRCKTDGEGRDTGARSAGSGDWAPVGVREAEGAKMLLSPLSAQVDKSSQRSRWERVLDDKICSRQPEMSPRVIRTQTDDSRTRTSLELTSCSSQSSLYISLKRRNSFLSIPGPLLLGRKWWPLSFQYKLPSLPPGDPRMIRFSPESLY